MDLESQLRDLKTKVEQAQRARARAEMERDTALEAVETAKDRLEAEFGVTTATEAQKALQALETELLKEIASANAALRKATA